MIFEDGITEIGEIFTNQTTLEKVTLPNTLKSLGIYTFRGCTNLKEVVFPDTEFEILGGAFERCVNLKEVYIPESATLSGYLPFGYSNYEGTGKLDLTIYTPENSSAYKYAKDNDIQVVVSTREEFEQKNDSSISDWAKKEVEEARDKNLIPEVLAGKDLTQNVDRAEFASIAVALYEKLAGSKVNKSNNPFEDISGNVCEEDILKAYSLGVTTGISETTFEPGTLISREQLATMLCRVFKKYAWDGWSIENDNKYSLNYNGVSKFADDDQISGYARPSVYFMAKHNIFIEKTLFISM